MVIKILKQEKLFINVVFSLKYQMYISQQLCKTFILNLLGAQCIVRFICLRSRPVTPDVVRQSVSQLVSQLVSSNVERKKDTE